MNRTSTFDPPARQTASPVDPQGLLFDEDIGLPWSKAFLRIGEVATFLNVSEDAVQRLIESGELEAISAAPNLQDAQRHHRRISNRSVVAFVNRRRKVLS